MQNATYESRLETTLAKLLKCLFRSLDRREECWVHSVVIVTVDWLSLLRPDQASGLRTCDLSEIAHLR